MEKFKEDQLLLKREHLSAFESPFSWNCAVIVKVLGKVL